MNKFFKQQREGKLEYTKRIPIVQRSKNSIIHPVQGKGQKSKVTNEHLQKLWSDEQKKESQEANFKGLSKCHEFLSGK